MAPALRVEHLSKRYRVSHLEPRAGYRTLREDLRRAAAAPLRWLGGGAALGRSEEFWALEDISFEVERGEVVGIIGRNGAGKTTLLKVISRITRPTAGRVSLRGRVGSLLEVGTGFHPELTGRENIYLNGAILGMTRRDIERNFDEIVAFAETERFLDTPVKRYSSGMYVRLAFAVAAYLEPDTLLVDEVLAVGDVAFQKKCLGKMGSLASQGRTILFVSHNMPAVKSFCRRAILLEAGRATKIAAAPEVVDDYLRDHAGGTQERVWASLDLAPGNDKARMVAVRVLDEHGQPAGGATINEPVVVEIEYRVLVPGIRLNLSLALFTADGMQVFASPSTTDPEWFQKPHPAGLYRGRCVIPADLLNSGRYFVNALLVENANQVLTQVERAVGLEMLDGGETRTAYFGGWTGAVRPRLAWKTECIERD